MHRVVLIVACLFCITESFAQLGTKYSATYRQYIYEGFKAVYNFQFDKADSIYSDVSKRYPNDPLPYMISVNNYWWKIISGERTDDNIARCYSDIDKAIDILKSKDSDDMTNEDVFYVTGFVGYKLRLKVLEEELLSAANLGRENLSYIKK